MQVQDALRYAGGRVTDLAEFMGVSTQVVGNWVARGAISPAGQWELEYLTGGALRAAKRPFLVAKRAALAKKK